MLVLYTYLSEVLIPSSKLGTGIFTFFTLDYYHPLCQFLLQRSILTSGQHVMTALVVIKFWVIGEWSYINQLSFIWPYVLPSLVQWS